MTGEGVKGAMGRFYESKRAQELPKLKKKRKAGAPLTEEQIQGRTVNAMRRLNIFVFHTPLNAGGRASAIQASRYKRMGATRGTPDLTLLTAPPGFRGVFWEIKRPKGKLTSEQEDFMKKASDLGWLCICCKGLEANLNAVEIIYNDKSRTKESVLQSLREAEGIHIIS